MVRVCKRNHITGTRVCWRGAKADAELGGRQQPAPAHERTPEQHRAYREFRAASRKPIGGRATGYTAHALPADAMPVCVRSGALGLNGGAWLGWWGRVFRLERQENAYAAGKRLTSGKGRRRGIEMDGGIKFLAYPDQQLRFLARDAKPLVQAVVAGFTYDPGHSDLDNEQPINVRLPLGEYRRAVRLLHQIAQVE